VRSHLPCRSRGFESLQPLSQRPTLIAIALLATDVAGNALMGLEHVAMLLGMLFRVDEYAGHHHHGSEPVTA
jgi:hypothetical protein